MAAQHLEGVSITLNILKVLLPSDLPKPSPTNLGLVLAVACTITPRAFAYLLFYPCFRLLFGTLYPAYASYKAVRTKNVREYVKWMMYWIVFALFTCVETFTDIFLSFWFPFYYEIKIFLVIYFLSPATKGSSILYRKFVHPILTRREQEIDEYIARAKEQGYHTVLNLGSKGVNYATTIIMQTAIKGGGGLVNQIRKSYSLSDLTEKEVRKKKKKSTEDQDDADGAFDEEPRVLRRRRGHSPRRTASSGSQVDLYFPEVDVRQRPTRAMEQNVPLRSSEDVSSGYSSTEPLYSGTKPEEREPLVRTSSVGGAPRPRVTRASVKASVTKKSTTVEDDSEWSAMDPDDESQFELDEFHDIPQNLNQSLPIPISGNFFAPFVRPEYHYLFAHFTEEQLATFINQANSATSVNGSTASIANVDIVDNDDSTLGFYDDDISKKSPSRILSNMITDNVSNPGEDHNNEIPLKSNVFVEEKTATDPQQINDIQAAVTPQVPVGIEEEMTKDLELKYAFVDTLDSGSLLCDSGPGTKSGKNKRPKKRQAPGPPAEVNRTSIVVDDEDEADLEFGTPESSPVMQRKLEEVAQAVEKEYHEEPTIPQSAKTEQKLDDSKTNQKPKRKEKKHKPDMQISKFLHLPKLSFWNQKSGRGSPQEWSDGTSLPRSGEVSRHESFKSTKSESDSEFYISLHGEDSVREMSQSPSSKRRTENLN